MKDKLLALRLTGVKSFCIGLAFNLVSHLSMAQNDYCWTAAGSTGIVDESNIGMIELNSHFARIKAGVVAASVFLRYNLIPVKGIIENSQCNFDKGMAVLFVDNGSSANVTVRLIKFRLVEQDTAVLAEFNSNTLSPANGIRRGGVHFNFGGDFNFDDNLYYIEVKLRKVGQHGNPQIHAIRICNRCS